MKYEGGRRRKIGCVGKREGQIRGGGQRHEYRLGISGEKTPTRPVPRMVDEGSLRGSASF